MTNKLMRDIGFGPGVVIRLWVITACAGLGFSVTMAVCVSMLDNFQAHLWTGIAIIILATLQGVIFVCGMTDLRMWSRALPKFLTHQAK